MDKKDKAPKKNQAVEKDLAKNQKPGKPLIDPGDACGDIGFIQTNTARQTHRNGW